MVFENVFSYISLLFYLIIFFFLYRYVKKIIYNYGFNVLSIFILTFTLFYLFVPFIQTFFKGYRDNTSLFTILLNQLDDELLFYNLLISFVCLLIIIISYNLRLNKRNYNYDLTTTVKTNNHLYKKVNRITDLLFVIGVTSIILLIIEVGSLKTYLSLGSLTRGLAKDPTEYIRSSYLQLVTLSVIILVTPYLYIYLYQVKKNKLTLVKIIVAFIFSVLFLFYNQGRAPLIIFFLPLLFVFGKKRKKGFAGLAILFAIGIFLLNYLDGIFQYLAYGVYSVEKGENYITQFLSEFSYPFTNFALRNELVEYSGFRYMYDYIIWPFTMIPSSMLEVIGISKESILAISTLNTEAYGHFLGIDPSGGIPVDFLTFNYYQLGYIALFPICFIIGRLLKKLDTIFVFFNNNLAIKIIQYRISFSMVNILNNADISAIVRNRLDIVILIIILIYIYKKEKNQQIFTLKVRGESQ